MELCKQSEGKVLADSTVVLKDRSASQDARTRTGVCMLLAEFMFVFTAITLRCSNYPYRQSMTDTQQESQENAIISIVPTSLVDDEAIVRTAAARAFDILQEQLGSKAIDQTNLPSRRPSTNQERVLRLLCKLSKRL